MPDKHISPKAKCPACHKVVELDRRYRRKELITCPHCQQVLEVTSIHPQVLNFPLDPYIPTPGRGNHRLG